MKKQKRSKKMTLLAVVIWIVAIIFWISACSDDEENTFDFTVEEYEKTITDTVNAAKGNSFIAIKPRRTEGEKLESIPLMKGVYVLIGTNEENEVTDVNVMASTAAFAVYNREIKISFEALIKSVDPSLSVIQLLTIMDKLGMNWGSSMLSSSATYELNGVSYNYIGSVENDIVRLQAKPSP